MRRAACRGCPGGARAPRARTPCPVCPPPPPPPNESGRGAEPVGAPGRAARRLKAGLAAALLPTFVATLAPQDAQAQAPTLTATPGDGQVTLSWTLSSTGVGTKWGYKINGGGFTWAGTPLAIPGSNAGTRGHTVTGLTNGTSYQFIVYLQTATNAAYRQSNQVSATPNPPTAGVTLSKTSLTMNEGSSDTYTVKLDKAPTVNVTITVSGASGDVSVMGSPLTFTPSNFGTAQTITVSAARDGDTTDDTATLTHAASSTDTAYGASLEIDDVDVTVTDTTPTFQLLTDPAAVTEGTDISLTVTSDRSIFGNWPVRLTLAARSSSTFTAADIAGTLGPREFTANFGSTSAFGSPVPGTTGTVTIPTSTDSATEGAEAYRITLSQRTTFVSYAVGTDATADGTLNDAAATGPTITLTAAPGDGQVTLSWTYTNDDGEAFDHWRYAQKKGGGSYSGLGDEIPGGKAIRTHTVTGLENGAAYTFKVTRGVTSPPPVRIQTTAPPYSNEVTATPTAASVPARPSGLSATAGNGQVTLTWTDPEDDSITRYQVRRRKGSDAWGGWTAISGSDADTTAHTVTGLDNDSEYRFRIRARNDSGFGAQSAVVTATPTEPAGTAPAKPTGFGATKGDTWIYLTWTNPNDASITRWEYQQKTGSENYGSWTRMTGSGATTVKHQITGLTNGTVYKFKIRAVNGNGDGAASDEVTATPNPPTAPVLTAATSTTNRNLTLTWTHAGSTAVDYVDGGGASARTWWQTGHRLKGSTTWTAYGGNVSTAGGNSRRTSSATLGPATYPNGASVEVAIRASADSDLLNREGVKGPWSNVRTVTYMDTNTAALTFTGSPVTVAPGSTATYTVALTKAYAGTLSIASDDTSAATVSPPSLAFTTTNYNTAKTVTVTGVGNGTATIDHAFRLTGAAVDAIPDAGTVDVTVAAVPGVTVSPTSLTIDEGGSGAYTLRLNTAPAANVTVTVGGASGEVTVAGSPLTFTPANHGTAQTVTVGAGADADTANDRATLTHTSASTDNDYGAALAIDSVSVTVRDTTPGARGTDPAESPTGGMTYQQLDGAGGLAPEPVEYARELVVVPAGKTTVNIKSPVAAVATATRHRVAAALGRRILVDESVHVRLALGGGMVFAEGKNVGDIGWRWSANPLRPPSSCTMENGAAFINPDHVTSAGKAIGTSLVAGRAGESVAVFRLETGADDDFGLDLPSRDGGRHLPPEARAVAGGGPKCGTPNEPTRIFADIADHLAVPAGGGAYTAGISLHGDADDALAGRNASVALGGAATIVRVVDGLDAGVEAATQPVVAHVGTSPQPFLWFRDAAAAGGVTGAAVLGSARATIAGNNLHNPTTGGIATGSDLLPDGSVNLAVEGDFSIGAFSLGIPADAADPSGVCPAAGAAGSPATGNLAPAAGGPPDRATLGGRNAGTHHLCVRVAAANGAPIPAGLYRGTVSRTGVGDADETLATGVIGRIRRNGTTARLTYLTASGKYNQRLIIVNEGARDARYDLGSLVTEAGTRATPTAAAVGTVPAGGQVVLRVSDLVEFAGPRRRASATLSVVAAPGDIRVATTQVNLLDGSTDTLHIPVRGATVN